MKIVKFKDGKYAVRKGILFGYSYHDISNNISYGWWDKPIHVDAYCKGTYEEALKLFNKLTDRGIPVNE